MSNKALTYVLENSKLRGSPLLLMVIIADMANDDGECFPGNAKLGKKCRCEERNVQKLVDKCEKSGELWVIENGGTRTKNGWTNRYIISGMSKKTPLELGVRLSGNLTGVQKDTPRDVRLDVSRGVQTDTQNPQYIPQENPKDSIAKGDRELLALATQSFFMAAALFIEQPSEPKKKRETKPRAPKEPKPVQPRKPNPWYDAVKEVWDYSASLNTLMQEMLQGVSTKKGFKESNVEVSITPNDLLDWRDWYREVKQNNDPSMSMLEERPKVQSSITTWFEAGKPKAKKSTRIILEPAPEPPPAFASIELTESPDDLDISDLVEAKSVKW